MAKLFSLFMIFNIMLSSGLNISMNCEEITRPRVIISHIADFNADGINDTLISYQLPDVSRPHKIVWGKQTDSNNIVNFINDDLIFTYPDFLDYSSYFAVFNANTNDTINDITLYYSGRIQIDSLTLVDTTKIITIFGQPGLDSIPEISIDLIPKFQISPFVAIQMKVGKEVISYQRVDKRKRAYIVRKVYLDINNPAPDSLIHVLPSKLNQEEMISIDNDFKIYPNPTSNIIYIENIASGNIADEVFVNIIDMTGNSVFKQKINFNSNNIFQLNVSGLSIGTYFLKINNETKYIKTFNILIMR